MNRLIKLFAGMLAFTVWLASLVVIAAVLGVASVARRIFSRTPRCESCGRPVTHHAYNCIEASGN